MEAGDGAGFTEAASRFLFFRLRIIHFASCFKA